MTGSTVDQEAEGSHTESAHGIVGFAILVDKILGEAALVFRIMIRKKWSVYLLQQNTSYGVESSGCSPHQCHIKEVRVL